MRLSRKRAQELDQWGVEIANTYFGPKEFARKLVTEGQPFDWEQGFLEDTSKWVCENIVPEPDWQIAQDDMGYWYVYEAPNGPHTKYLSQKWKTREHAEEYLELWKRDWWYSEGDDLID